MSADSLQDREDDAVRVLSDRLGALRRVLLVPLALLSAVTTVPVYFALEEMQLEAQWASGAEVAYHVPLLSGALALFPPRSCSV